MVDAETSLILGNQVQHAPFLLQEGASSPRARTKEVVRHWQRLPGDAVDAPSLDAFKAKLDRALGSLI